MIAHHHRIVPICLNFFKVPDYFHDCKLSESIFLLFKLTPDHSAKNWMNLNCHQSAKNY